MFVSVVVFGSDDDSSSDQSATHPSSPIANIFRNIFAIYASRNIRANFCVRVSEIVLYIPGSSKYVKETMSHPLYFHHLLSLGFCTRPICVASLAHSELSAQRREEVDLLRARLDVGARETEAAQTVRTRFVLVFLHFCVSIENTHPCLSLHTTRRPMTG